jgi:2-polyprenyl-3-methyl-5-hydroxy-6-metoxy-1,4-benzoquinol methylase
MSSEAACPLCDSKDVAVRGAFSSAELRTKWQRALGIDISAELAGTERVERWGCARCGLEYFLPRALVGSPSLYEALETFEWYYLPDKWEHLLALTDLAGARRGLEIGSGFGSFVASATQLCPAFAGCEQNPSALRIAKERGLNVQNIDLEKLSRDEPASHDAVCAFQVLEHVGAPGEFLTTCCALLKPGGKLMLGLPDAESYLRYHDNVLDLPPHHMTRWTESVVKAIPRFFPLRLLRLAHEPLPAYQVSSFAQAHLARLAHLRLFRSKRWRRLMELALRPAPLRQLFRGQGLYAVYERTEAV